ncbi:MAG: hypothetical protein SVJ22_06730 [Halobacteriota archaeon]|nr:hypothetical protein [Halobacteriota archaeon]
MKELKLEVKKMEDRDTKVSLPCDAESCASYIDWCAACPMCM